MKCGTIWWKNNYFPSEERALYGIRKRMELITLNQNLVSNYIADHYQIACFWPILDNPRLCCVFFTDYMLIATWIPSKMQDILTKSWVVFDHVGGFVLVAVIVREKFYVSSSVVTLRLLWKKKFVIKLKLTRFYFIYLFYCREWFDIRGIC